MSFSVPQRRGRLTIWGKSIEVEEGMVRSELRRRRSLTNDESTTEGLTLPSG